MIRRFRWILSDGIYTAERALFEIREESDGYRVYSLTGLARSEICSLAHCKRRVRDLTIIALRAEMVRNNDNPLETERPPWLE